jgi:hypothetical protein
VYVVLCGLGRRRAAIATANLFGPASGFKQIEMPEFILSPKFKQIFNEYDLSVIKAHHFLARGKDLSVYRSTFVERIKERYPNRRWLPLPLLETISKIEGLSDSDFLELMETFRYG